MVKRSTRRKSTIKKSKPYKYYGGGYKLSAVASVKKRLRDSGYTIKTIKKPNNTYEFWIRRI